MDITVRLVSFAAYGHSFPHPMTTARGILAVRHGWYVAIHCDQHFVGIGEVAPLPEIGTESYESATEEISLLLSRTEFPSLPASLADCEVWTKHCGLSPDRTPTLCYGMECALAAVLSQSTGRALSSMLSDRPESSVALSPVISVGSDDEVLASAHRYASSGFRSVKIKVGKRSVTADAHLIRELHTSLPTMGLRADANGAWDVDEAKQFCEEVGPHALQYIEDPLRSPAAPELRQLRKCGVPIALDEPVRSERSADFILGEGLADVLVLKPAAIGSLARVTRITRSVREHGAEVVFSNLYESGVGLRFALTFASALGSRTLPHGLYPSLTPSLTDPVGTLMLSTLDNGACPLMDPTSVPELLLPELKEALGLPPPVA